MKFIINKNLFLNNLMMVQKATASKTSMPALTGILLTASTDSITFVASNMDFSIKTLVKEDDFKIESEGRCLVPGKLFVDVIRKLNGNDISIELETDNILRIISGSTDVTMNLLDVADYPMPEFNVGSEPIVMKASAIKEIIKETTFASSAVDNKPILTGVNFRIYGNKLLAVSTDSFRLSRRSAELDKEYLETNIIVPSKNLNELSKSIADNADTIQIYLDKGRILFVFGDIVFQSRLLEGNYPDTTKLIPTNFPIIVKFNKYDLIDAIDRVSTMSSNPNATPVVKLQIESPGIITLSSNSPELGNIKDVIAATEIVSMNEIKISFSAGFFLDALRAFNSEEVSVKFTGEIKPFIFEAEDDPGLVELVLPMKSE